MYIRTRLTLWFLFLLILLLTVFSLTVYQLIQSYLIEWLDKDVHQQASSVQARIHLCPGQIRLCIPPLDVFHSPDLYLQVRSQNGAVLASSGNLENHMLPIFHDAPAMGQMKEVSVDTMLLVVYCQPVIINHTMQGICSRGPCSSNDLLRIGPTEKPAHSGSH